MTKSALNSDLAVSARAAGAAAPAAEQLDFLAPVAERINRADADAIAANATEERKRGRPKGAENLSSRQLREMLIRAGGHPLIHLARWATMTPEEMARRLDCKVVEAFDRQVAIWDKLAHRRPGDQCRDWRECGRLAALARGLSRCRGAHHRRCGNSRG